MAIKIRTYSGHYYIIHDNAQIERCDGQWSPSGKWTAIGMAPTHPFCRHFEPHLSTLHAIADGLEAATYKNGKPRYTLMDNDHGGIRQWGDGIVAAWRV
jgi:hypothetical protein